MFRPATVPPERLREEMKAVYYLLNSETGEKLDLGYVSELNPEDAARIDSGKWVIMVRPRKEVRPQKIGKGPSMQVINSILGREKRGSK